MERSASVVAPWRGPKTASTPQSAFFPLRPTRNSTLRSKAEVVAFAEPVQIVAFQPWSNTKIFACRPVSNVVTASCASGVSSSSAASLRMATRWKVSQIFVGRQFNVNGSEIRSGRPRHRRCSPASLPSKMAKPRAPDRNARRADRRPARPRLPPRRCGSQRVQVSQT